MAHVSRPSSYRMTLQNFSCSGKVKIYIEGCKNLIEHDSYYFYYTIFVRIPLFNTTYNVKIYEAVLAIIFIFIRVLNM